MWRGDIYRARQFIVLDEPVDGPDEVGFVNPRD
jgi:hypothetical protein